jgi:hypothetical protein
MWMLNVTTTRSMVTMLQIILKKSMKTKRLILHKRNLILNNQLCYWLMKKLIPIIKNGEYISHEFNGYYK